LNTFNLKLVIMNATNLEQTKANGITLFEMRKWWTQKAKWYHRGEGHFDVDLYLRICKAKENRKRFDD
jgi:hypothetical protein